jgi:cell division protein FtsB
LFERFSHSARTRRGGYTLLIAIGVVYGLVALRGPQGVQVLLDKHGEIRQLEEQNASTAAEIQRRKERIQRLESSTSEQEIEIRKQLKLLRPGETTFILPDRPQPAR